MQPLHPISSEVQRSPVEALSGRVSTCKALGFPDNTGHWLTLGAPSPHSPSVAPWGVWPSSCLCCGAVHLAYAVPYFSSRKAHRPGTPGLLWVKQHHRPTWQDSS